MTIKIIPQSFMQFQYHFIKHTHTSHTRILNSHFVFVHYIITQSIKLIRMIFTRIELEQLKQICEDIFCISN